MAPSGADRLRVVFADAGIPVDEVDQEEVDEAVKELRKNLVAVGKSSSYESKHEWHRALLEVLHVAVPTVVEGFGEVLADPDPLGKELETVYTAVKTVKIAAALGAAPRYIGPTMRTSSQVGLLCRCWRGNGKCWMPARCLARWFRWT